VATLRALGFAEAGRYKIDEAPGTFLWSLMSQRVGVTATLSESAGRYLVLEMASHYSDGTSFAVCAGDPAWQQPPPFWTILRHTEVDPQAMLDLLLAQRPDGPLDADSPDEYATRFEKRYARIADWRNSRGGFSEDEIRALFALKGLPITDEQIAEFRRRTARLALTALQIGFTEHFLANAESDLVDHRRLVFVHDRLDPEMVVGLFRRWRVSGAPTMDDINAYGTPPRQFFALWNDRLGERRFEPLGRLRQPLDADVYLAPI
jgi:hypothetical protein